MDYYPPDRTHNTGLKTDISNMKKRTLEQHLDHLIEFVSFHRERHLHG